MSDPLVSAITEMSCALFWLKEEQYRLSHATLQSAKQHVRALSESFDKLMQAIGHTIQVPLEEEWPSSREADCYLDLIDREIKRLERERDIREEEAFSHKGWGR